MKCIKVRAARAARVKDHTRLFFSLSTNHILDSRLFCWLLLLLISSGSSCLFLLSLLSCSVTYVDVFIVHIQLIGHYVPRLSEILSDAKVIAALKKLWWIVIGVKNCD